MSTAVQPRRGIVPSKRRSGDPRLADVLVIFGITGDLAKVMTFQSLYRLERRGLLDCPIVGVAGDDWTLEHLREHARESHRRDRRIGGRARSSTASRRGCPTSAATSPTRPPTSAWQRRVGDVQQPGLLPGDPAVPVRAGDQAS